MKVKKDFVTNSSSSSFVVMGINFSYDMVTQELVDSLKVSTNDETLTIDTVKGHLYNYVEEAILKSGLQCSEGGDYWSDNVMVGLYYTTMADDETLAQFKERTKQLLKERLKVDVDKVYHIETGWEDR